MKNHYFTLSEPDYDGLYTLSIYYNAPKQHIRLLIMYGNQPFPVVLNKVKELKDAGIKEKIDGSNHRSNPKRTSKKRKTTEL